jgi:hypothetical protein
MQTTRKWHRSGSAVLALVAVALIGCGTGESDQVATAQSSGGGPASSAERPADDPEQRGRQYASCLRGHGIDVADPEPGRGKVQLPAGEQPGLKDAQRACQAYAPDTGTPGDDAAEMTRARDYAACMRNNGLPDFPDPDPDKGPVFPKQLVNSPGFEAANRACQHILNSGGKGQ